MVFFIGSEVMLFGSFFTAYFFVRFNIADQWPPAEPERRAVRAAEAHHRASTPRSWCRRASPPLGASTACSTQRPQGARARAPGHDLPRRDVPDHPDQRVHPPGLHAAGQGVRLDVLHPHRRARAPRVRGPHDPDALLHPRGQGARLHRPRGPRRSARAASTGTSSTSSGCSSSCSSTSYDAASSSRRAAPASRRPSPSAAGSLVAAGCGGEQRHRRTSTAGKTTFANLCASCHTLADSGKPPANIGPNLDDSFRASRQVGIERRRSSPAWCERVDHASPSRRCRANLVQGQDATNVAAYIASVAGTNAESPPRPCASRPTPEVPGPAAPAARPGRGPDAVSRTARGVPGDRHRRVARAGARGGRGASPRRARGWW